MTMERTNTLIDRTVVALVAAWVLICAAVIVLNLVRNPMAVRRQQLNERLALISYVDETFDADNHLDDAQLRDYERDTWLRSQGVEVLRIRDRDAFEEPVETAERIAALIASRRR